MIKSIDFFGNRNLIKLLAFSIDNSTIEMPQKEIKKGTKLAQATLTKWLNTLEEENLIKVRIIGANKLYSLNKGHIVIKQLKILNNILKLAKVIKLLQNYNVSVYLYGSSARGEDTEKSDIDLLAIGRLRKEEIIRDLNKIAESIGRKIKLEIFSPMEWSNIARKDKAFYERIEKDKIELKWI